MRVRSSVVAVVVGLAVALVAGCAPPPTLTPAQQVDAIVAFVERARGHEFVTDPVVQFVPDAEFRAEVEASVDAARAAIEADQPAFRAVGWIRPDQELFAEYRDTFGGGVAGFYDPAADVLKVRGTTLTPYRREVIAHELTHALDDQVFGLDDLTESGLVDEAYRAALVAIEGSAVKVQQRYHDSQSDLERLENIAEQLAAGADPGLLDTPVALLTVTSAPYLRGAGFADELIGRFGNPAGIDAALQRYPTTAEQAFDVDAWVADEQPVALPTPPADGPVVRSGTWGQFMLTLVLRNGLALDRVDPATVGWAGDAYVTWSAGGRDCLRLDTAVDDATADARLTAALTAWAATRPAATVEDLPGHAVRLTTCSAT